MYRIVKKFGDTVGNNITAQPQRAFSLLNAGYTVSGLVTKYFPDKGCCLIRNTPQPFVMGPFINPSGIRKAQQLSICFFPVDFYRPWASHLNLLKDCPAI